MEPTICPFALDKKSPPQFFGFGDRTAWGGDGDAWGGEFSLSPTGGSLAAAASNLVWEASLDWLPSSKGVSVTDKKNIILLSDTEVSF